jgi:hypothetical protein
MPGRPITDQQHRLYMTLRQKHPQTTAAAMAGFSPSTGHRAEKESYARIWWMRGEAAYPR